MADGLQEYAQGDFLIRNIVGLDGDSGMVAIGEFVSRGQVVQFHLRDAEASSRDLETLLDDYRSRSGEIETPDGALLFSCLGRGEVLYGVPDHDSRTIAERLGPIPIGGFFCQGEIGPVNRQTYIHGYTSSIALFRPLRDAD
jgi:small ligand-binding sensory domain FIST